MQFRHFLTLSAASAPWLLALAASPALAAGAVQIGTSGKTFASTTPQCAVNPATGLLSPSVQAGLFNPSPRAEADVKLDGVKIREVEASAPTIDVWLPDGSHTLTLALNRRTVDSYTFTVAPGVCALPPGNFYSADGTLEYAASGKSSLTVTPGCALNPITGLAQPFVNLFDNGSFVLNVSINGTALTQLSATRPRAIIFLSAGQNLITAANGSLSTDSYRRDGGSGSCVLP